MAYPNYTYGAYPAPGGYYSPPMPDQLAQLRSAQMPPMQQPMMGQPMQGAQMQQPTMTQTQPVNNSMIWVQGEAGAKSFLVANGNTVPLWDSENQTVYIKTVDASGMPSMRILDYTERTNAKPTQPVAQTIDYVTRDEWTALTSRADALAQEIETLKSRKCSCGRKAQKEESAE